jgi:hypothetical protein
MVALCAMPTQAIRVQIRSPTQKAWLLLTAATLFEKRSTA